MNCTNCGEVLAPGTSSCPKCGTVVQPVQPVVAPAPEPAPVAAPVVPETPVPAPSPVAAPVVPEAPVAAPVPAVESVPVQTPMFSEPAPTAQPEVQAVPVAQPMPVNQQMPAGMPQPSPVPVQQQPAPQPSVGGIVPSQNTNKGGSKKGLVIGIIVILLLAVLGLGGYLLYDKIQEDKAREELKEELEKIEEDQKEQEETKEELKNKVQVTEVIKLNRGALLLIVENTSSKTASADIEIEFYDASNKILGTQTEYVDLAPNMSRYIFVSEYSVKEGYETVKTNVSSMDFTGIVDVKNVSESELIKNETEDEILLQYKNSTEYEMDMETIVIFYSGKALVYALDDSEHFIAAGNNANLSIDLYDMEGIQYDRYEVYSYAEYDVYDD